MVTPSSELPIGARFSLIDHVSRAWFFHRHAQKASDLKTFNWLLLASVYFARAPIEIMINEMKAGRLEGDFQDFLENSANKIRHFKLIERVRVHDFHRNAVFLNPGFVSLRGPLKIKSGGQSQSGASASIDSEKGLQEERFRNGSVSFDRPLQTNGLSIFDDEDDKFIPLVQATEEYLLDLVKLIETYYPNINWG